MIALFAVIGTLATTGLVYQQNHAHPTRRTPAQRLVRRNPGLRFVLVDPAATRVLQRADRRVARRIAATRRRWRRKLTAGLLAIVSVPLLLIGPVPTSTGRRTRRHANGLETIQLV
jgi:hypothetical protein